MSDHRDEGTSGHMDVEPVNKKGIDCKSSFIFIVDLSIYLFLFSDSYLLRHGGPSADQLKVPFSIATSSPSKQERKIE